MLPSYDRGSYEADAALRVALTSALALATELEKVRAEAAKWESVAVLRAATIANDLTLRAVEAERSERQLRGQLKRALHAEYPTVDEMRRDLQALAVTDDIGAS